VIALSVKDLPGQTYNSIQSITRDEVECELNFLGLLVMENKMKDVTPYVIKNL